MFLEHLRVLVPGHSQADSLCPGMASFPSSASLVEEELQQPSIFLLLLVQLPIGAKCSFSRRTRPAPGLQWYEPATPGVYPAHHLGSRALVHNPCPLAQQVPAFCGPRDERNQGRESADFPQFLTWLGPQLHPLGEFRLLVPLDTCPTPAMIFCWL